MLQPKEKLLSSLKDISIIYEVQNQYDLLDKSEKLIKSLENINDLYSIKDIFIEIDNLNQTKEDTAFQFIDLAQSYRYRGLYSQSAENFSKSLDLKNSNLDFKYYYDLILEDTTYNQEMINAFEFIAEIDSSFYGSYFYLSLLHKQIGNHNQYMQYMDKYIKYSDNNEKALYLKAIDHFEKHNYIE